MTSIIIRHAAEQIGFVEKRKPRVSYSKNHRDTKTHQLWQELWVLKRQHKSTIEDELTLTE